MKKLTVVGVLLAFTIVATGCDPVSVSPGGATDELGNPLSPQTPSTAQCVPGVNTSLKGFDVFPPCNPWRRDVSGDPVDERSDAYIASIGVSKAMKADFGTEWEGAPNGIQYQVVTSGTARVPVEFTWGDESDVGPYPFPASSPIEGGPGSRGDRHIIAIDCENNRLFETYNTWPAAGGWTADSGAIFNLGSLAGNGGRPEGWTSADAAGLPIFPGLVRYDEVYERREINHALRFTVSRTQKAYVAPASHWASSVTDANVVPMGARLRLKASVSLSSYSSVNQVILRALKKHGMIVADNGTDLYLSGAPHPAWNDTELRQLMNLRASDFEVVATGPVTRGY